jgi:8-oxo-dGTP diphosphatase
MAADQQICKQPVQVWPKAAASIAVLRGHGSTLSVLLVERSQPPRAGLWSLPGGHIEPGETAVAAAMRELAEETGVSAKLIGLVDTIDVIMHDGDGVLTAHFLLAVFCGHWLDGEPVAASDSRRARFVTLADLPAYQLTPDTADIIARASRQMQPK